MKKLIITLICVCCCAFVFAQTYSAPQAPRDTTVPVNTAPVVPSGGTEPDNRVMLKSQTDSMSSKNRKLSEKPRVVVPINPDNPRRDSAQ